jgi:hypothetical protein
MEFYWVWTILLGCNYWLGRATSSLGEADEPRYEQAYWATTVVDRGQRVIWLALSIVLLIGLSLLNASSEDVGRIVRLFSPALLWIPVCLVANSLSLVLALELHDLRFLGYRLISIASTLLLAVWLLVEAST